MEEKEFQQKITLFVEKYALDGWELKKARYGIYAYNPRRIIQKEIDGQPVFANYYIDYDHVFTVPVLSATFFTETGHQLTYSELLTILPQRLEEGSISEREHELTGKPVFFIHPCKTQQFVEPFLKVGADYLHVWLVKYGPLFFYKLPF
ncbi:E2-like conjugating enzyme atg10 [Tritrichomonas musculus]|uniref:E2-like conjugating enzyme atg10 n=1 Tax=Tritrichomonas musculus TaxID=1915356 RepID=A0ABR2KI09_9EUKA